MGFLLPHLRTRNSGHYSLAVWSRAALEMTLTDEGHGGSRDDRREHDPKERVEQADCDRHSERVTDEDEEQVLMDVARQSPARDAR
jgi:hypothetical protein